MFAVIKENCRKVGNVIAGISMRRDAFNHLGPELKDDFTRACIFLYVSAICHQTETLSGKLQGKNSRGWDYLMGKFIEAGNKNPSVLTPQAIRNITTEDLQSIVSDNSIAATSTLSGAEERAKFLRNIGEVLVHEYQADPRTLYGNGFLEGKDGLYQKMSKFIAFGKDPIKKKSTVFFQLMYKSGLWNTFKDSDRLRPMPDYHKMRLFLRTGCIVPVDKTIDHNLRAKIKQNIEVDNELREATCEAYLIVLKHSNKDFFELEVFLWSFARSLCYHSPRCISNTGPGNFLDYADLPDIHSCPFEGVCAKKVEYWQPIVDTNFH